MRVFTKMGYRIARESGHIIMSNGKIRLVIPTHNPINSITMGNIVKAAGLTPDKFRDNHVFYKRFLKLTRSLNSSPTPSRLMAELRADGKPALLLQAVGLQAARRSENLPQHHGGADIGGILKHGADAHGID